MPEDNATTELLDIWGKLGAEARSFVVGAAQGCLAPAREGADRAELDRARLSFPAGLQSSIQRALAQGWRLYSAEQYARVLRRAAVTFPGLEIEALRPSDGDRDDCYSVLVLTGDAEAFVQLGILKHGEDIAAPPKRMHYEPRRALWTAREAKSRLRAVFHVGDDLDPAHPLSGFTRPAIRTERALLRLVVNNGRRSLEEARQ